MNSTIVIDASSVPNPNQTSQPEPTSRASLQRRNGEPRPRLTFGGVVRSERIKLTSLRGVRITMLVSVVAGLGLSLLMAWMMSSSNAGGVDEVFGTGDEALQSYLLMISTFSASFLSLVFGVLGVFAVASEYSSGMILSTLTAVPKRMPVALAKTLVLSTLALLAAVIVVGGGLGIAAAFAPKALGQIGSTVVISGALGTVAYLVIFALFAMGVAGMLRSSAGAIAVVTGVAFVLPVGFQVLTMTGWAWVYDVMNVLPSSLGSILSQGTLEGSVVGFWPALALMAAWAAATLIPAAIVFVWRDAK
ncbi:ABC transporter permease [Leucobacter insecticola]|uniref:ABC transporter permease n=1 Tax=Leucobacter insecticola TaxID=2714934 RepID=A0A6G8FK68_9MICO|nr:ABC transporter permease [Leucobacter insecticola]QIM16693.1 ABC transporter permease [Leucobacter insecticola]